MEAPDTHPHVVILPFPAQGHIKPMLILGELLSRAGFTISFINNEHNHRLMSLSDHNNIKFHTIPDGLPLDQPRTGMSVMDLFFSINNVGKPALEELIASLSQSPTCIISDGIMSFAIDVAADLGIPVIIFRTHSATCTWIYFHLEKLIQHGEIPVAGVKDMDKLISCIPGVENIIRRRDLPSMCRLDAENPMLQFFIAQTSKITKASALILNTFEELELPFIFHLHSIFPTVYAIGPLHAVLESDMCSSKHQDLHSSSSLMQIDKSCMDWLDLQQPKSVIYVSFGTVIVLSQSELMEFWHGLVNSGKPFLWAMKTDLICDESHVPKELETGTKQRGLIVGWTPQEDVLAHDAVGGFLTHSGWNSTLESIYVGKPMICWPKIADQQVNSRCVSEMWNVGFDMKDGCDRSTVEKMVRDLMDGRREEILERTDEIARLALGSLLDGGSSNRNIKKLIEDIKSLPRVSLDQSHM